MKSIETLIPDIYSLVKSGQGWFTEELSNKFGAEVSTRLRSHFGEKEGSRKPTLRLSQMGDRCPCALWYSIHHPELGEPLPAWATIKFAYGHILEALVIALAKGAGHEVTGEQDELNLDGIVGHRDCVIDSYTVDVKSAASRSFDRIKAHSFDDTFGYLDQLAGYVLAAREDPLVTHKDVGYILAIDKQKGHLCLHKLEVSHEREEVLRDRIRTYKSIVSRSSPPPCECGTVSYGASGNVQLDLKASYSAYKHCCHPHVRTFLYSSGPVYLTVVKRKPEVTEVDKNGKVVYN